MDELARDFKCPYESCNKNYAYEGSLNLHIKLKHNGGNKTDREKNAKILLLKKKLPNGSYFFPNELEFNLPPNIIRKVASELKEQFDRKFEEEHLKFLENKLKDHNRKIDEKMRKIAK